MEIKDILIKLDTTFRRKDVKVFNNLKFHSWLHILIELGKHQDCSITDLTEILGKSYNWMYACIRRLMYHDLVEFAYRKSNMRYYRLSNQGKEVVNVMRLCIKR